MKTNRILIDHNVQRCPQCGSNFYTYDAGYWHKKFQREKSKSMTPQVSKRTRVFCSDKCKQKAYRARKGSKP